MKKIILLLGCFLLFSCQGVNNINEGNNNNTGSSYPKLKIENDVNQDNTHTSSNYYISSVSLVNYKFEPLYIYDGESQTFVLDKGMPGGYDNILVYINYDPISTGVVSRIYRKKYSFQNGKTTIVKLSEMTKFPE